MKKMLYQLIELEVLFVVDRVHSFRLMTFYHRLNIKSLKGLRNKLTETEREVSASDLYGSRRQSNLLKQTMTNVPAISITS